MRARISRRMLRSAVGSLLLAACASTADDSWVRSDGSSDPEALRRDRDVCLSEIGTPPVGAVAPMAATRERMVDCLRREGWRRK